MSKKPPANTTTETRPPAEYIPYFTGLFGDASRVANSQGDPYGGQFLAPTQSQSYDALGAKEGVARGLFGAGDTLGQLGQAQASGAFLNSNPYLQQAINQSLMPAIQNFTGNVMPQFNSDAINSGAFKGSSARDFGAASLGGQFGRDLLGTASQIGFENYANERQLQQNSGQLLDQSARLNQLGPELLSQVGLGYQDIFQRMLDEQLLQYQEQQQAPWRPLNQYASILQGQDIGSTMTQFGQQPSALAGGITGALAGGQLGATAGSASGVTNGGVYGGLLGAAGGAAAGAWG